MSEKQYPVENSLPPYKVEKHQYPVEKSSGSAPIKSNLAILSLNMRFAHISMHRTYIEAFSSDRLRLIQFPAEITNTIRDGESLSFVP